mmetsp:Transcript_27173/g.72100  ORF Transcript_27173/g.72100 Transcript_27173/m.72100 type:complete len:467 (+) Transcript_27173:642-2042(+)
MAQRDETWEGPLAHQDLTDRHERNRLHVARCYLLRLRTFARRDIGTEPESLGCASLAALRNLHIPLDLRHGNVQVELGFKDRAGQEHDKGREGSVLKVGDLDLHASELHPPTNVALIRAAQGTLVRRWRLPTQCLPIGALQIFPMVDVMLVVKVETIAEEHQRVTREQVSDVPGERLIHAALHQAPHVLFVQDQRYVVVLRRFRSLSNVAVDGVVPRLRQRPHTPPCQPLIPSPCTGRSHAATLGWRAVVNRLRQLAPACVVVANPAAHEWRSCREREHYGRQRRQLVVEVPRLRQRGGLHCDLQATISHAEGHGIRIHMVQGICLGLRSRDGRILAELAQGLGGLEAWTADLHPAAAAEPDVFREGWEARMWKDDLVRDEQGLGDGTIGFPMRLAESWDSEEGHGGDCGGYLSGLKGCRQARPAQLHVGLQLSGAFYALEGVARGRLEHPAAVLRHPSARRAREA